LARGAVARRTQRLHLRQEVRDIRRRRLRRGRLARYRRRCFPIIARHGFALVSLHMWSATASPSMKHRHSGKCRLDGAVSHFWTKGEIMILARAALLAAALLLPTTANAVVLDLYTMTC